MSGAAVHAAPPDSRGSDDLASGAAANSARTPDPLDNPVALREQNRRLAELITDQLDTLRAVRRYAEECMARAGAQLDAATVAATLLPLLAGFDLACQACAARRVKEKRHAELLVGLADLQRAGTAG